MHAIERELIKVTNYKSRTKFSDRQDYLASILNAVSKLDDDDFDNLSDEAAEWANAAVEAKNSKEAELPDFDEVSASEEAPEDDADAADEEGEDEAEDSVDGDEDSDDADSDTDAVASDPDDDDDDEDDEEADGEDDDTEADDDEDPEDDGEDEPEPKPAKKAAPRKAAKPDDTPKLKPPPKKDRYVRKPRKTAKPEEDVVLDKWGCMEGSKNHQALNLFEKGATAAEVKEQVGGTYYNVLKKMVNNGHTIEKEGAVIKLIHKDAKKAAKAPAKKAKK